MAQCTCHRLVDWVCMLLLLLLLPSKDEEAAQDRREGHRGLCPLMVLRVVRLQPRVLRASESRIRPVHRLVDSVERQNHRVMMASLPPVALVLADGMDR